MGWFLFPILETSRKQFDTSFLINRCKGLIRGWAFEFTNKKSLDTSIARNQLQNFFKKKVDIKWKLIKRNQTSGTNRGVILVAVKMAACIWTYINFGDVFNLMNRLALKIFNVDPDLNIKAARSFLCKTSGKLTDVAQYLEKVLE